jgi:surface antigen
MDSIPVPIQCLPNGSIIFPRIGSLLIWDKKGVYQGTGHVAIVTRIYPYSIQVIEQNTDTLTRTIGWEKIGNQVWVEDVLGWIHYE